MLSPANRLRHGDDFRGAVRRGRRAGSPTVIVHLVETGDGQPPRAGFVTSKAVGGAVVRNRIRRRLRALMRDALPSVGPGVQLVVRATPAAATASTVTLAADLEATLRRVMSRGRRRPDGVS